VIYQQPKTVEQLDGKIEVDDSYFGDTRKGYRGREAAATL